MLPLNFILEGFLDRQRNEANWHHILIKLWPSIVGTLNDKMCLRKIEGSALLIGVYDSHWMHELAMLSPTLIRSINLALSKECVTHIRFIGSMRDVQAKNNQLMGNYKKLPEKKTTMMPLLPHYDDALQKIQDHALREYLKILFYKCDTP